MKVPHLASELEQLMDLVAESILQIGHEPFVATDEFANHSLREPREFMPFACRLVGSSGLMTGLYQCQLRGRWIGVRH